jgi:hypothetical protein
MDWQIVIAVALVAACSSHAIWSLLPAALRGRVAVWRGKPMPATGGCGSCEGCGGSKASAAKAGAGAQATAVSVIHIVRRPPAA